MERQFDSISSAFLAEHTTAVLSTVSSDGVVHGAVIYYVILGAQNIYFISKTGTTKIGADENTRQFIVSNIVKPHAYQGAMLMPPVTSPQRVDYVVVLLQPTDIHDSDYRQELLVKISTANN